MAVGSCISPARDMAKIGYLYLNNGEWDGKKVVPKEYVLASTKHLFDDDPLLVGDMATDGGSLPAWQLFRGGRLWTDDLRKA